MRHYNVSFFKRIPLDGTMAYKGFNKITIYFYKEALIKSTDQNEESLVFIPINLFCVQMKINSNGKFKGWTDTVLILVLKHQINFYTRVESTKSKIASKFRIKYCDIEYDCRPFAKLPLVCKYLNFTKDDNDNVLTFHSETFSLTSNGTLKKCPH